MNGLLWLLTEVTLPVLPVRGCRTGGQFRRQPPRERGHTGHNRWVTNFPLNNFLRNDAKFCNLTKILLVIGNFHLISKNLLTYANI